MTVKKFLETMWKSYAEFIIVKDKEGFRTSVLDMSMFLCHRELLKLEIHHLEVHNNTLYIYCC